MADGDLTGSALVRNPEPREVALHWRVEVELARLGQLHDRQGGEGLAQRADDERRLRRDGPPRVVRFAKAAEVRDPVALDDAEREPGDPLRRHLVLDEALDRSELAGRSARPLAVGASDPGLLAR